MKTVLILLRKELHEWKEIYSAEKQFFKGQENDKWAKRGFLLHEKHISELKQAIYILNKH